MKKKLFALMLAVMTISIAACGPKEKDTAGSDGGTDAAATESSSAAAQKGAGGYTFDASGVTVEVDAPFADIESDLGEPVDFFESESCAFGDLDKVYTYSGFRIDTYQLEGTDYVSDVVFMDDTISTPEGVAIGDSVDKMKEAYGEPTEEDASQAIYEKGDMKLVFILDGDTIKTIEYLSKKLDS